MLLLNSTSISPSILLSTLKRPLYRNLSRSFSTTISLSMPKPLEKSTVDSKTDPSVAAQWDHETPKSKQIDEFYKTVDGMKIGLLTTIRPNIGPVARSMAVAKVLSPQLALPHILRTGSAALQAEPRWKSESATLRCRRSWPLNTYGPAIFRAERS